ncbi:regucalcin-like [Callospermophilus lateralis]|uniref:regucalcin-like n=1 Tax=Callospermophilus lateralis TaxID=76772 RepID=UPI004038C902
MVPPGGSPVGGVSWRSSSRATLLSSVLPGDPVGCVALCREGSYVVASGTCLGLLYWEKGQVEWAAWLDQDKPHNRFNSGKVDPAGRFVAGGLLKGLAQATCRASHHGGCQLGGDLRSPPQAAGKRPPGAMQLDQLGIPNGLDWSLDHHSLYHVDGLGYSVRSYDYDVQTGGLANPRLVCQLEPEQGMLDGLFMDTTGTLWVACIDGGRVIRMDAETGTRLCTPEMPVSRVTSCCFGGADYSDLYVTSAADSLSPEQLLREPQAGHVFTVLGLGVRSLASCHFSG